MALRYSNILEVGEAIQERVRVWRNSTRIRKYMISQNEIAVEEHRAWLSRLLKDGGSQIVRVAFCADVPIGIITLKDIDRKSERSDWGIYIGESGYEGRGFGREMLDDLLSWGFEEEGLNRLFTSVTADNAPAIGMYLRAGFHFEGRFEKHIIRSDGEKVDLLWVALFRPDWRMMRFRSGKCATPPCP